MEPSDFSFHDSFKAWMGAKCWVAAWPWEKTKNRKQQSNSFSSMAWHSIFSPVLVTAPLQTSGHVPCRLNCRSKYIQHWINMDHQKAIAEYGSYTSTLPNAITDSAPPSPNSLHHQWELGERLQGLNADNPGYFSICLLSFPGTHTLPRVTCGGRTWRMRAQLMHSGCVIEGPHRLYNLGFITETIKKGCT